MVRFHKLLRSIHLDSTYWLVSQIVSNWWMCCQSPWRTVDNQFKSRIAVRSGLLMAVTYLPPPHPTTTFKFIIFSHLTVQAIISAKATHNKSGASNGMKMTWASLHVAWMAASSNMICSCRRRQPKDTMKRILIRKMFSFKDWAMFQATCTILLWRAVIRKFIKLMKLMEKVLLLLIVHTLFRS